MVDCVWLCCGVWGRLRAVALVQVWGVRGRDMVDYGVAGYIVGGGSSPNFLACNLEVENVAIVGVISLLLPPSP